MEVFRCVGVAGSPFRGRHPHHNIMYIRLTLSDFIKQHCPPEHPFYELLEDINTSDDDYIIHYHLYDNSAFLYRAGNEKEYILIFHNI